MMQVISLAFVLACSGNLHFSPQEIPTQQFEEGFDVALRSNSAQIFSTENLNPIEQLIENLDQDTLVLFDVDQTLITPDDPILKPKYDKLLDDLMGGKKFITDESGKTRYIFREILMHAPHSLIDPKSSVLVQKLQAKGIPVIAFSAAPGGKIGEVDSFIDWRINELHHFGFDFQSTFPHIQTLELPKDMDLEFPPIYKSGVLITSLHDKGPVLLNFFKESNWTPKKVVFIDDQMSNIRSVVESLEGHTETLGIHYRGASLIPCSLENKAAKYQVDHFLETGSWISQTQAIVAITENNARSMAIKSVLFDFGGVLVEPDKDMLIAYLSDFFGVHPDQIRELQVNELQWIRVNNAEFSFWQNYGKQIGKELPSKM